MKFLRGGAAWLWPLLLLGQTLSAETLTVDKIAVKYPAFTKETLFKTEPYWTEQNALRLKTAEPAIQKEILNTNLLLKKQKKHYTVGYTSVYNMDLKLITGMRPIMAMKDLPQPPPSQPPAQPACLEIAAQPTDASCDMRDYGIVSPIENQGQCGSCWAFATVAGLETSILLQNGFENGVNNTNLRLSEEQVLSCTGLLDSCGGGFQQNAAGYVCGHPVATYDAWPYSGASNGSLCSTFEHRSSPYQGLCWGNVCGFPCLTPDTMSIKRAIVTYGSVVCGINATNSFSNYAGGVFDENNNPNYFGVPSTNHVIQLIGWNDGLQAWLVKNSWGTGWGYGGFAWVRYGSNNIGAYALWVQARKFGANPCAPPVNPPTSAKLLKAVVTFDNCCQGKDTTENYWLYLYAGSGNTNLLGTYVDDNSNQNGLDYDQGHSATVNLSIDNPITYQELVTTGSGNMLIALHGNFGGLHFNSDWKTRITLNLIFDNGATYTVNSNGVVDTHTDHNHTSTTWVGNFTFNGQSTQTFR
jgi:C1A family cysteine protease